MAAAIRKDIDPRHRILRVPAVFHEATTKVYTVLAHGFGYQVNVHTSCICNELVSLHNRHLVDRTYIPFNKRLWREVARETRRFYRGLDLAPWAYEEVIAEYTGNKKRMYRNACVELRTHGLQQRHMLVKMFVKPDRYPLADCEEKDPRAIQYRSPHFNIAYGAYVKPFEEWAYPNLTYGVASGTRVIAKGMNNYDRAALLLTKVESFKQPRFVLLDHSRFDSTINQTHLRTTHAKYQMAFNSGRLARLCKAQLVNVGYTKHGIKYKTKGTRMSGDSDTGLGNSLVNADCLYGFLTRSGVSKYDFILDGDDSVVIVEASDLPRLDKTLFGQLGFDTKMQVVADLDEVEFCQCKMILAQRPLFSRNPARALSHSSVARKRFPRRTVGKWIAAVGECERACNIGVPVLQAYGESLASISKAKFVDEELRHRWRMGWRVDSAPITADARATFALAWGVPPEVQQLMEKTQFTANAYCSWLKRNSDLRDYEQFRLASSVRRISSIAKSTPERSGSSCCSTSCCRYVQE
nr:MAG: RNA-dependent RNA polymerase [Riboviria sp.]